MAKERKRPSRSGRQQPAGIGETGASTPGGNVEGGNVPGGNVEQGNVPGGNVPGGSAPVERAPTGAASIEDRPNPDRVAARAYELYQARGGADGRALDDWLEAERELSGGDRDPGTGGFQ